MWLKILVKIINFVIWISHYKGKQNKNHLKNGMPLNLMLTFSLIVQNFKFVEETVQCNERVFSYCFSFCLLQMSTNLMQYNGVLGYELVVNVLIMKHGITCPIWLLKSLNIISGSLEVKLNYPSYPLKGIQGKRFF